MAGSREGVTQLWLWISVSVDRYGSAHRLIVKIGPILVLESSMRLTIDVDDESLMRAAALTGMTMQR